jgi:hypothetical protein
MFCSRAFDSLGSWFELVSAVAAGGHCCSAKAAVLGEVSLFDNKLWKENANAVPTTKDGHGEEGFPDNIPKLVLRESARSNFNLELKTRVIVLLI